MANAMMIPAATEESTTRSTQSFPAVKVPVEPSKEEIAAYVGRVEARIAKHTAATVRPARRVR